MPLDVTTEIIIDAPVDAVALYAADPDNAVEWYDSIETVNWKTPKPLATGTQVDFVAKFLGRSLSYVYEVVEYQPGRHLVMRTSEGPFPMETTYTWRQTDDGRTHMALRNRGEPAGFSTMLAPLMAGAMRKTTQNDLEKLKSIVEGMHSDGSRMSGD